MSYPQNSTGMTGHPEIAEMRERLERTASSGRAIAVEGLILLTGLYAAISPWVVHFSGQPDIAVNNLIVGICVGLIGVGLALVPERTFRLVWTLAPIGVWLVISPWVVTAAHGARAGIIWSNCFTGAVIFVLGLAAMGITVGMTRPRHR
ncbi:SPW repeat protein [Streptomyces brasiliensis]|uniref:Membrane protein n=1 Tax=Streptomyces brasiliensis TaxID=1954 RepID=A0A917UPL6_9ACTN|nr:SPW repeat protein [Streptomyces brasiliensis]GGJ73430.1 membrane protein [Streptomyces brasiliensis]